MGIRLPRLKAVIFDLDGCLVDSELLALDAIAAQMRAVGIQDATAQEIGDRFLGVAMPVIVEYVATRLGSPPPADFAERIETSLLSRYEIDLRRIEGATDLLAQLQQSGIAMAIATGGSLKRMAATLDIAGLAPWFCDTASSAEEVMRGKPAPDLFELACRRLQIAPSECIVLEDSPHGIKGALAAGIAAIGFVGGSHLAGQRDAHAAILSEAGASAVFTNLAEVAAYVLGTKMPDLV